MDQLNFEDVQFAPLWNIEATDFSDETRSVSSFGSVKDEHINSCYLSCRGSTCSSPYDDDSFDFPDESALLLGDSPYQFEPFNTKRDSSTLQHNDPNVMADPFLWLHPNEVPEETLRNLELMNMLSGFHYFQQPQNVMNAKQELDAYVPSPLPPPIFSMSNRQDTKQLDEKNLKLIESILKSQKPPKEESKPFPDITEVEKYIKREESSCDEIATPTIPKKRPGDSPTQPKGIRKKRKYERRATARKSIQLYEFMLNLLDKKDESVTWVSREEGVFKLLKSKGVAQMWGKYKKNDNMTYESLSRALRHYYAQEILVPVPKKLHYRFCKKTLDNWYKRKVAC